jgi:hypothetical protein
VFDLIIRLSDNGRQELAEIERGQCPLANLLFNYCDEASSFLYGTHSRGWRARGEGAQRFEGHQVDDTDASAHSRDNEQFPLP